MAWFASTYSVRAEKVLDLGSGLSSVAMITAWRLPGAKFVTIEAQERSFKLAQKSVRYNLLQNRFEQRLFDFRDSKALSESEIFDCITGSPPYFPLTDGITSENPQKLECRFEARGDVTDYCKVAAKHLAPGGNFFLVFPLNQEQRVLQGAEESNLIILRTREVIFKEGETPLLALYQMAKREDFPPQLFQSRINAKLEKRGWVEPPLTIRTKNGEVHPEYSVVKMSVGFPP